MGSSNRLFTMLMMVQRCYSKKQNLILLIENQSKNSLMVQKMMNHRVISSNTISQRAFVMYVIPIVAKQNHLRLQEVTLKMMITKLIKKKSRLEDGLLKIAKVAQTKSIALMLNCFQPLLLQLVDLIEVETKTPHV